MREFLLKFTVATRFVLLLMIFTLPATTVVGQTTFVADSLGYAKEGHPNPTITSDKEDYAPGETAIIEGYGWTLDSVVDIHIEEEPTHLHHHGFHGTEVNDDGYWRIEYPITVDHIGVKFTVIVDGLTSKYQGKHHFTDGNVRFTTTGLPTGTPLTVNVTYDQNGVSGVITEDVDFTAPDGGTNGVGVENNTSVSYTYAQIVESGGVSYMLSSTNPSSPFVLGNGNTTVSATYIACTMPVVTVPTDDVEANSEVGICGAEVTYTATSTGSPSPDLAYSFSGDTTGSGLGTGSGSLFNVGVTTVTITATNSCGSDTESFTVTVTDDENPVLTAAANQDVVLGDECTIVVLDVTGSATDNCAGTTIAQVPAAGSEVTAIDGETINVEVTATDAAGNTDSATVVLTAQDLTAPVLTAEANQDVDLDANCSVTIPNLVDGSSATDNCTYTITQSPEAGEVVSSEYDGTIEVTVTATDAAGNTDVATVTLTAKDITDPALTAASDQDVDLDANCSVTIPDLVDGSTATDNCTYTITQSPEAGEVVSSEHNGTIAVTVTATDAAGNFDESVVTLTAKDVTDPVLTAEADQDVNLDGSCSVTIPNLVDGSTATDNCTYTITQSPEAGEVVSSEHNGTIEVTVTATDAAGNKDDAVVTLTAKDVTDPVLTAEADQDVNLDGSCSVTIPNLVDGSTATDNCTYTITQSPEAGEVVSSEHNGTIEVTVTATDAAGNTDVATVTLTAKDITDPALTAASDQDVDLDANCSVTIPDLVDGSTATDNCTYTITQSPEGGEVVSSEHNGTIAVTVTATDAAGNFDESVVTLTAKDVTDPVLTAEADQDVNLDGSCSVTIPNLVDGSTATDNCTYTITQSPEAGEVVSSEHNGTIEVTVTATDAAGNKDDAVVTLTAKDVTDPVLTAEADQDVNLDGSCSVTIPNLVDGSTATDNCTYTITQSPEAGEVVSSEHNGTIEVTVTATDAAGNKDDAVVTLTAKDVTDPVLTAEADQDVNLDGSCSVTIPNLVDGSTATDNCTYTITQSPEAGEVVSSEHNGTIEVTVTATDAAGNTDVATVTLTAKDITDPALTAASDQDVDMDENCAITVPDLVALSSGTDNCTYTITQSPEGGEVVSSEHNGTIAVTVTATDAAGNFDESVVTLTAKDVTDPVLTAEADQDVNLDGSCSVTIPNLVDGSTATDNCTYTITQSPEAGEVVSSEHNGTIEVTVTATDAAGNKDDAVVTLTAKDVTDPVLTAEADQNVDLDGSCSVTIPDLVDGSTAIDNCTYMITQSPEAGEVVSSEHNGTIEVTVTATDAAGNKDDAVVTLTAKDVTDPVLTCVDDQTKPNDPGTCSYTVINTEFDPYGVKDNCQVASVINDFNNSSSLAGAEFPEGDTQVKWTVTDAAGNKTSCSFTVTVTNDDPVLGDISAPEHPVEVGTGFSLSADYVDNNIQTVTWIFSTGSESNGTYQEWEFTGTASEGEILNSFNPSQLEVDNNKGAGVYSVKLVVSDHCGVPAEVISERYVVIFDPTGGFVTGGGWIESPANALYNDYLDTESDLVGRANFGFNAKYKNGKNNMNEVDGHTNFQFKAGDLHFSSIAHDDMSLVISGKKATYTGYGTVNGTGNHKFRLIAIDGDANGGGAPDEFRIKIWKNGSESEVLYDNMRNESESSDLATVLGGGSIVIHKPKGGNQKGQQEAVVAQTFEPVVEILSSMSIAPNPVVTEALVRFSFNVDAEATVEVFDVSNRKVAHLFSGQVRTNEVNEVTFNRDGLQLGNYFVKVTASNGQTFVKQIILKD